MDIVRAKRNQPRNDRSGRRQGRGSGRLDQGRRNVPDGFCLTTNAFRRGELPRTAVLEAYRYLGEGPVAVRSRSSAEDLPDASFAGQHEM